MDGLAKPKRVVIVDADNPMEEIHGEFFWRADKERLLDTAPAEAFEQGHTDGQRVTVGRRATGSYCTCVATGRRCGTPSGRS